jgi:hypothetical protein
MRENAVNALVVEFYGREPDDFDFWADAIACHLEFTRDVSKALKAHICTANVKDCEFDNCSAYTKTPRVTRVQRKRYTAEAVGEFGIWKLWKRFGQASGSCFCWS